MIFAAAVQRSICALTPVGFLKRQPSGVVLLEMLYI